MSRYNTMPAYNMLMDNRIEKIKKVRLFLIEQLKGLSEDQLNKIPEGFNNKIIWNLVHLIAAQQGICYLRAAQKAIVPDKYIFPFFPNTRPESVIEQPEIQEIKHLLMDTIDKLQTDYSNNIFTAYKPPQNVFRVYGIELKDINDALEFLLYHEGYHTGCILALKKLVS